MAASTAPLIQEAVNQAMIGVEGKIPAKGSPAGTEITDARMEDYKFRHIIDVHNDNVRKGTTWTHGATGGETSVLASSVDDQMIPGYVKGKLVDINNPKNRQDFPHFGTWQEAEKQYADFHKRRFGN
jgi:hypothetical protein